AGPRISAAGSRLLSTSVSVSETAGWPLRACSIKRAVSWSGAVARAALPRTTMPTQPGGHRYDRGTTATLMAGVNPAAAPARHSHSSLARAVSAAAGVWSVPTNNDRTENRAAVTPDEQARLVPGSGPIFVIVSLLAGSWRHDHRRASGGCNCDFWLVMVRAAVRNWPG